VKPALFGFLTSIHPPTAATTYPARMKRWPQTRMPIHGNLSGSTWTLPEPPWDLSERAE